MKQHSKSLFAASREAAQQIMDTPVTVLRYETTDDKRVRSYLTNDGKFTDEQADEMLKAYHRIAYVRRILNI